MIVKDLKKILENIPDDCKVIIRTSKRISEDKLKSMSYPYLYDLTSYDNLEFDDIGYSDKVVVFSIEVKDD